MRERQNILGEIGLVEFELTKSQKALDDTTIMKYKQMDAIIAKSIPPQTFSEKYYLLFKTIVNVLKYVFSCCLVLWALVVIIYGVANDFCIFQLNPAAAFVILICATILLTYLEALHYANVSVEKWDLTEYKDRFPRACEVQKLVTDNKLVRQFLVGRQFCVIFVVFVIVQITSFPHVPKTLWGLPESFVLIMIQTGIPGILFVLTFGQLIPQLYVEEFCLPFLNLPGCYAVTKFAFGAEYIGVCHFSWLLFHSVNSCIFGRKKDSDSERSNKNSANRMALDKEIAKALRIRQQQQQQQQEQLQLQFLHLAEMERLKELKSKSMKSSVVPPLEELEPTDGLSATTITTLVTIQEKEAAVDAVKVRRASFLEEVGAIAERRASFDEDEPDRYDACLDTYCVKALTMCKYLWSSFVTLGAVVIILYGISQHYSVLPAPVP